MPIELKKPGQADLEISIQSELKDKSIDSLILAKQKGIRLKPIYAKLENFPIQLSPFLPYRVNFEYFLCPLTHLEEINQTILRELENGASGLIIDLNNDEHRVSDFQRLLKDVLLEFIHIEFLNLKSISELNSFLAEYLKPLSDLSIAFNGADKFAQIVRIPEDDFMAEAGRFLSSVSTDPKSSFVHIELSGDYFWDIAKMRAFKSLLNGVKKTTIRDINYLIIGETPLRNKSGENPENNLLKLTTEAMSALLGVADGIWIKPFDFELDRFNQFSQRMSRNVYNLLMEESHLNLVDDPAKGSFFLEKYTEQIAREIYKCID